MAQDMHMVNLFRPGLEGTVLQNWNFTYDIAKIEKLAPRFQFGVDEGQVCNLPYVE